MIEPKITEIKHVRGYVAPTDTGTVRLVRSHEKLVEVDVKKETKKEKKIDTANLNSKSTLNKISELNKSIRLADFSKDVSKLNRSVVDLYRAKINTNANPMIDANEGLKKIYDKMNKVLLNIGFENKYNLTAKQAMIKLSSPEYMKSLSSKTNMVQKRVNELGLKTTRIDPFTFSINQPNKKSIYVSNNPLDHLTSEHLTGKIDEKSANILASINQNEMNDFVFFTTNKPSGGTKTASSVVTYNLNDREFYHHSDELAGGKSKRDVSVLGSFMNEKISKNRYEYHGRSLADSQVFEVKAMIMQRLSTMQKEIEERVKEGEDPNAVVLIGDQMFGGHARERYAKEVKKAMQLSNSEFEGMAREMGVKSLATNSPLHSEILSFKMHSDAIVSIIEKTLEAQASNWKKFKQTYVG